MYYMCITHSKMNLWFTIQAIAIYAKLWIEDTIDYYHGYLLLTLPTYMFGDPVFTIKTKPDDDSSSDETTKVPPKHSTHNVFIKRVHLIQYDKSQKAIITDVHGKQFQYFVDEYGKFFIGHLEKYYTNLETMIISYSKVPNTTDKDTCEPQNVVSSIRVIDVKKRYDIRNLKSYKLGLVL